MDFITNWELLAPDPWVRNLIQFGYKIEFTSPPPTQDLFKSTPVPRNQDQRLALEEEINALLQKRAIYPDPQGILFRSSFFLTPKKPDSWRAILNLKPLNKLFVRPKKFRMETLKSILPTLRQGHWACTIDLRTHIYMSRSTQTTKGF